MPDNTPTHRYMLWLGLIVAFVIFIYAVAEVYDWLTPHDTLPTTNSVVTRTPPPTPAFTQDRTVQSIGTKSFSALISYTDTGFEPKEVTIKKGDMIRFTNNSTAPMLLTSDVSTTQEMKDALPPGEYAEFTFNKAGDKHFFETGHNAMTTIIHVK